MEPGIEKPIPTDDLALARPGRDPQVVTPVLDRHIPDWRSTNRSLDIMVEVLMAE